MYRLVIYLIPVANSYLYFSLATLSILYYCARYYYYYIRLYTQAAGIYYTINNVIIYIYYIYYIPVYNTYWFAALGSIARKLAFWNKYRPLKRSVRVPITIVIMIIAL